MENGAARIRVLANLPSDSSFYDRVLVGDVRRVHSSDVIPAAERSRIMAYSTNKTALPAWVSFCSDATRIRRRTAGSRRCRKAHGLDGYLRTARGDHRIFLFVCVPKTLTGNKLYHVD